MVLDASPMVREASHRETSPKASDARRDFDFSVELAVVAFEVDRGRLAADLQNFRLQPKIGARVRLVNDANKSTQTLWTPPTPLEAHQWSSSSRASTRWPTRGSAPSRYLAPAVPGTLSKNATHVLLPAGAILGESIKSHSSHLALQKVYLSSTVKIKKCTFANLRRSRDGAAAEARAASALSYSTSRVGLRGPLAFGLSRRRGKVRDADPFVIHLVH
jgi:hypothetical protein